MNHKRIIIQYFCLATAIFFLISCASAPTLKEASAVPDWVSRGSGAFNQEESKVFYGVGIASGIRNPALLRSTADNRARAEIAKTLETYVAVLAKDYMAATSSTGQTSAASEEQHVEQALKTFSKTTLHGAIIVDHWQDAAVGTLYSLCRLDLAAFQEALEDYSAMDQKIRDHIRRNAEKLHTELEKMEQQR